MFFVCYCDILASVASTQNLQCEKSSEQIDPLDSPQREKKIARARRTKEKERLKKEKEEKAASATVKVPKDKTSKESKKRKSGSGSVPPVDGPSTSTSAASVSVPAPVSNVASKVVSTSAASTYVTTSSRSDPKTVSITSTQVSAAIQKQFGDVTKRRKTDSPSNFGEIAKNQKLSSENYPGFNVPSTSKKDPTSAALLMSTIQPPSTRSDKSAVSQPVSQPSSQSFELSSRASSEAQKIRGSLSVPVSNAGNFTRDEPGPSSMPTRRIQQTGAATRVRRSPSEDRGRSRSRSEYRSTARSVSIPVHATYNLLPGAGPNLREFDLGLQESFLHEK